MDAMTEISTKNKPAELQSGQMRQQCPNCGEAARIRHSVKITSTTAEYYMQCQNIACGMTWKSQMDVIHIISPSADQKSNLDIPFSPYSQLKYLSKLTIKKKPDEVENQITIFDEIEKTEL